MRRKMLGTISILMACSTVYAAENTEKTAVPPANPPVVTTPAVPATPAATTPTEPAVAAPATPAATSPAPATATPTPAATTPATPATSINLSGKWSSNLIGDVSIEQTGNKIKGTYQYEDDDDVTQDGQFEGLIEGKKITAKWWERPKVGKGAESRGDLEWKITDDGKTLTGWYRDQGEKEKVDFNLER